MKNVPESTQIRALNAANTSICNILSEVMIFTTTPPGMEAGFAQLILAAPVQLLQVTTGDQDIRVVQFTDETEGSGKPQMTAIQGSHEVIHCKTERQSKFTKSDLESEE